MSKRDFNEKFYVRWRKAVIKRDRKCQYPGCGMKTKLQAHHINRWADAPLLRYNVNNGITLCKLHHKTVFNKEEQFAYLFHRILMDRIKNNGK